MTVNTSQHTIVGFNGTTGSAGGNYNTDYRDGSEVTHVAAYKVGVAGYTTALGGRLLGEYYDLLMVGSSVGLNFDEITYSGKTYVLMYAGGLYAFLLPKE